MLLLSWVPADWGWATWVVLGVAAVVLVVWVVSRSIRWATSQYVITNRRVIVRSGIIARQGRDMPLARVNDVHFSYGVIDRLLGCGDLIVESAGETGRLLHRVGAGRRAHPARDLPAARGGRSASPAGR